MTGAGLTMYLAYLGNFTLAILTIAAFAPLIGFHFAITKIYGRKGGQEHINPRESRRLIRIHRLT